MPDFRGPCQSLFLGPLREARMLSGFTRHPFASRGLHGVDGSLHLSSDLTSFFILLGVLIASSNHSMCRLSDHDQGSLALL